MPRNSRALVIVLAAAAASGCLRTQAKTPDPPPSLTIPSPPDRIHLPFDIEPPPVETPPPVEDPATAAPPRNNPPPRPNPPAAPPAAATTPPPAQPDSPPTTVQPSNMSQIEARARERLREAQRHLATVSFATLPANGRSQYIEALRLARLADQALNAKNFNYADHLANNAATLARLLNKK